MDHSIGGEKALPWTPANLLTQSTPTLLSPWQMKLMSGERGAHSGILCSSKHLEQFFKHFQFVKIHTA